MQAGRMITTSASDGATTVRRTTTQDGAPRSRTTTCLGAAQQDVPKTCERLENVVRKRASYAKWGAGRSRHRRNAWLD